MINRLSYFLGLAGSAAASPALLKRDYNTTNTTMAYSFKDVPITPEIQYIPCFDTYTCTQLEVPLDYDDPAAGTTNIAFIRYEAAQQPALGDIIFNPGGPGGSAIGTIMSILPELIAGLGGSHNIVGMDPRGVNNSGPLLDCFNGQPWLRDYYYSQLYDNVDPRSDVSLKNFYEFSGTFGTWCTQNLNKTAKYANTPATARDMLRYAELLAESQGKPREEAKVDFYGLSYGSALGTTFASLYPNHVGRFLIDAVLDGNDYYYGNWSQNLLQADAAVESFFKYCAEAGSACAFKGNSSTAEEIQQRFDDILLDLERNPIPVTDPLFVSIPTVVTHIDVRNLLMGAVYNPPLYFPIVATVAADLENRNGSLTAAASGKGVMLSSECNYSSSGVYDGVLPKEIIACNDNNKSFDDSEESLVELFAYQKSLSKYLGDTWPLAILPFCRNLDTTPPKSQLFPGFKKVNTSTPILFSDNTIDPVTSSYDLMSSYFEGSRILLQEAVGHGLIVASSNCTSSYVQQYFRTGELPPKDTVCKTDFNPFSPSTTTKKRGLTPHHPAIRRSIDSF